MMTGSILDGAGIQRRPFCEGGIQPEPCVMRRSQPSKEQREELPGLRGQHIQRPQGRNKKGEVVKK